MRILVADDDPVARRLLELTLERAGHEVTAAVDGLRAWDVLQRPEAPRFAILDWMIPGMDGMQICREVRRRIGRPYTYLLLLTARGQHQDVIAGMEAGADDYLAKPFDPLELHTRLRAGERVLDLQTRLVGALDALREQAMRDALTGLWSHSAILDYLCAEIARSRRASQPLGVLLADLDDFKRVNDTYGHRVSDSTLHAVAERLSASLRPQDRIGRYGGDRFLVVLPGGDWCASMAVAERLRVTVAASPVATAHASVPLTMSLGLSVWECTADLEPWPLIEAADSALSRAKVSGRNRLEIARPTGTGDAPAGLSLLPPREMAAG